MRLLRPLFSFAALAVALVFSPFPVVAPVAAMAAEAGAYVGDAPALLKDQAVSGAVKVAAFALAICIIVAGFVAATNAGRQRQARTDIDYCDAWSLDPPARAPPD